MVMMSPTLGTASPGPTSAHAGAIVFSSGRLEPGARYWKIIWVRMCYLLENALVRMLASKEAPRKPQRGVKRRQACYKLPAAAEYNPLALYSLGFVFPSYDVGELPAAGLAPLLLCLVYKDKFVGAVVVGVIRTAALRAPAAGGLLQGGHSPLYGRLCHCLAPFIGWPSEAFTSKASILASRSSASLILRSCSMALRRVFMSWLATAARSRGRLLGRRV